MGSKARPGGSSIVTISLDANTAKNLLLALTYALGGSGSKALKAKPRRLKSRPKAGLVKSARPKAGSPKAKAPKPKRK